MAVKKRSTTKGKGSSRQKTSNRKKANPGRSSKRRKANDNSDKYGIVLLGVGILMLLSLLSKFNSSISMGSFGKFSYGVLTSFLGLGAFILPFIVLALGYMYIVSKGKIKYTSRFYGIIIVICSFLVLLNIFNFDTFYNPPNMMTAFEKIKESTSVFHGGILSFLVTVPLCGIFGKTGGTLIVIIGFLIGGICITELDIESVIKVIRGYFGRRIEERRERNRDEVMPENEYAKNKGRQREQITKEVAVSDNRSKFQKEADRVKIVDFLKSNTIHESQERIDKSQQVKERNIEHQSPVEKNVDIPEKEKWSEQEIEIENSLFKEEKLPVDKEEEVKEEKSPIHMKEESECIAKMGGEGDRRVSPKTETRVQKESEILKGCLESEALKDDESMREKEIREYIFPSINLLKENREIVKSDTEKLKSEAEKLTNTLKSFGVKARVSKVTRGPSVTRFEIQPEVGVKVSKIVNLSDDIALNLAAASIRIEAPIPGKAAVGIEVPNRKLVPVLFKEIIESKSFQNSNGKLTTGLGKDISGKAVTADLSKMPHVLVAGATGSGKSVCINSLIISLLYKYSPEDVKLLMIDPKVVELNVYNGIPHLLIPVVTDPRKAAGALSWAVGEMERRYKAFADNGAKNIDSYNEMYDKGIIEEKMPYIVIIIDELADLMMVSPKDVEGYIARLAQMARAAGMHLVIATQRPSVDVITGMIKANIPSRIAFAVSSQVDSRTIIDSSGAEKLLGKGDMLFMPIGESKPKRIQGAFISESEVEEIVNFIKIDKGQGEYHADLIDAIDSGSVSGGGDDGEADPLLSEAIELVLKQQKASTSMIQRKFKIGYNRAARIIEDMEERGIISGPNGSKPRTILLESMEEV